jgi:phosphate:Na+ symporter
MLFLENGFRTFTGGVLEKLLAKTTDSLTKSIAFGVVTTTVMQSSSLVSVITISFLSAGLIGLAAGIGIIFGANLGTTTGAWLIAGFGLKVKISAYALPMLAFAIVLVFQKSNNLKGLGYVLAGLGLLFLGIHHMKVGFETFRETIDLTQFAMTGYIGLFVFTGVGMAATVIMQSSHATLVLIITALAVGQISYENALAMAIGANIGTTITAIISSMGANYMGKRLALAHLIFNAITGLIAIIFIAQMIWAVDEISIGLGIREDDFTLKLAVFHSLFNTIGVLVIAPFVQRLVELLERLIPTTVPALVEPKYLNESVIEFPETLSTAVRNEILYLYDNALEIIAHGLSLHRHIIHSDQDLAAYVENDREVLELDIDAVYPTRVKSLYSKIFEFISRAQTEIPPEFANSIYDLRTAAQNIVQSLKEVKHLRKNTAAYIASDNDAIRREYNEFRLKIATVLRTIHRLREGDESVDIFDLDDLKLGSDEDNSITDGTLSRLIREGEITAAMATSVMNDYVYAENVVRLLADAGRILFGETGVAERDAQELLRFDEEEREALSEKVEVSEVGLSKKEPAEEPV